MIREPIRPGSNGTVPVLCVLKSSSPVPCKIRFWTPNVLGVSKSYNYISDNMYEHFDFSTVEENIIGVREPSASH
jgi:hypothetical protein